jgi:hypothetical protein
MNRHQQAVIECLQEENRLLLEQLGGQPRRFTEAQRLRLARQAKLLGRRRLGPWATLVTPDTLLRWCRVLIAKQRSCPVMAALAPMLRGQTGRNFGDKDDTTRGTCWGLAFACWHLAWPSWLPRVGCQNGKAKRGKGTA